MTGVGPRVAVAAVAVLVLGWLGVMERDHRLLAHGSTDGNFARGDSDLRKAGLLNADSAPLLARAIRLQRVGRWREAVADVERVLRREPDNLFAWNGLALVAHGHDPAAVQRAGAAARRLDPLGAGARAARPSRR